jgi:DNA helicase-2/ATP-dependent DNA helicase PcrA
MTIHSAKGLEFKYVYIVGLEENLFPSAMNLYNPKELEEERRLFYVALTRACSRVTLSYALNRYKWGTLERSSPSRFIGEIESEFLWYPQTGGKPFGQRAGSGIQPVREKTETFSPVQAPPPGKMTRVRDVSTPVMPQAGTVLEPGDRVTHERFGEGEVTAVEGEAPNTTAVIEFRTAGTKKLLLRFAKLTKL